MKVRKKPVIVDAIQLTKDLAIKLFLKEEEPIFGKFTPCGGYHEKDRTVTCAYLYIETLEGKMKCELNDWIIKGVNGEFYPCKPDIFEKTYDKF